jgi:hypothetical protein
MRYELTDHEWAAIKPMLPNKPRGVPRSVRPYFNRYTEDAFDLCDVLSSFSPHGKATLHEIRSEADAVWRINVRERSWRVRRQSGCGPSRLHPLSPRQAVAVSPEQMDGYIVAGPPSTFPFQPNRRSVDCCQVHGQERWPVWPDLGHFSAQPCAAHRSDRFVCGSISTKPSLSRLLPSTWPSEVARLARPGALFCATMRRKSQRSICLWFPPSALSSCTFC